MYQDARPEYGPWSTDAHMEASVKAGLGHISMTLRPPVIVTRDESEEEPFFMRGIKRGAAKGFMTHISLPTRAADCRWITDLDAFSLSGNLTTYTVLNLEENLSLTVPFFCSHSLERN